MFIFDFLYWPRARKRNLISNVMRKKNTVQSHNFPHSIREPRSQDSHIKATLINLCLFLTVSLTLANIKITETLWYYLFIKFYSTILISFTLNSRLV